MANYIATTEQFTATANAIRAKTGSSGSLEWDASTGYADDIAAIVIGENLQSAANVSFGGTYAFIKVAYPEGSTCTCTKGNTTLTAEDTSGSYTFAVDVPSSGTDTWTVSCTDGTNSKDKMVDITSAGIITVSIEYISIITFKILGFGTFEAVDGMTWEEWVNSDYNPTYISVVRSVYIGSGFYVVVKNNWEYVNALDPIIEGHEYRWYDDD